MPSESMRSTQVTGSGLGWSAYQIGIHCSEREVECPLLFFLTNL
jgi:hypothetical protein